MLSNRLSAVFFTLTMLIVGKASAHLQKAQNVLNKSEGSKMFALDKCPDFLAESIPSCGGLMVPQAYSFSGGMCSSVLMQTGWMRTPLLNPAIKPLMWTDEQKGAQPVAVTSGSGGTLFFGRYLVLRNFPSGQKWSYPCHMLNVRYREMCVFHESFGGLVAPCEAEFFEVVDLAITLVYGPLFGQYGGMTGVAALFSQVYFTFLNNLPVAKIVMRSLKALNDLYVPWNRFYGIPAIWNIGLTRVNPKEANPVAPYNYGVQSWLSRGYASHTALYSCQGSSCSFKLSHASPMFWLNYSVGEVMATSCFYHAMLKSFPFAVAGKQWSGIDAGSAQQTETKVFLMALGYVMMRRMLNRHILLRDLKAPMCEDGGCSVADAGMIDNGPLTPGLAFMSALPDNLRPKMYFMTGPAASFDLINFQLGTGKFNIFQGGGGAFNLCALDPPHLCGAIETLRKLVLTNFFDKETNEKYRDLRSVFDVNLPENQVIHPFCGDPLAYDEFHAQCSSSGFCTMTTSTVPSKKSRILFTPQPSVFVLAVVYLSSTPLAVNYVHDFLPIRLFDLPYFAHMDQWFPNFQFSAAGKGGIGFTKPAGHSLMDFLTYLSLRLSLKLFTSKAQAWDLQEGKSSRCGYKVYNAMSSQSLDSFEFAFDQQRAAQV